MRIKIFFFIPSLEYGGASNAVINFLRYLNKSKFDLNLIYQGKNKYKKYLPSNVKLYKLNNQRTLFNFFKIKKILLENTVKSEKNVFISNIHFANVLSILFLRKIKKFKIILFERTSLKELDLNSLKNLYKNKIVKFLIRILYNYADLVLTNSKNTSNELKKLNINSKVVRSGLILKNLSLNRKKEKSFFKFIAVGRLENQKDYITIFKAIKLVKNNNFTLYIYGDGSKKLALTNYIKNNNLNKKIKLVGHVNSKKKIYLNADLLINSSVFEGLANCIVESINYKVPVIASDIGGNKEILCNGKYGDLFKTQSERVLAIKIKNFLKNPDRLRKKINRGSGVVKKFNIKVTSKNLENIILNKVY